MGTQTQASEIFHNVMSPYCQGLLLSDCPSTDAGALRQEIKDRLAKGEKAGDIEADLYRRFGNDIRTMPEAQGFGLGAWVVPPVVFAAATVFGVLFVLKSRREAVAAAERRGPAPAPRAIPLDMQDRLEDELSEIR